MPFDASLYGETIANILAFDGDGQRLLPLVCTGCSSAEACATLKRSTARELFPEAPAPVEAMSGLWLYFSCFKECHELCDDLTTPDGMYWHAMVHRQEPDPGNAGYWFRQVGPHPVFPALLETARGIAARRIEAKLRLGSSWDPLQFIDYCEAARQRSSEPAYEAAREVQRAEWQLLFDYCARPRT